MASDARIVKHHVQRGHELYDRGDVDGALAEWSAALALQPDLVEVKHLISGALEIATRDTDRVAVPLREVADDVSTQVVAVVTEPVFRDAVPVRVGGSDEWATDEVTKPEGATETAARLRRAEAEAAAFEAGQPAVADSAVEDGAPALPLFDVVTRQIGTDGPRREVVPPPLPSVVAPPSPPGTAARLSMREARKKAAELIDRCRVEFERRKIEEATAAAEEALQVGDAAPSPGIAEVIEPARSLFERIFAVHVGPTTGVPMAAVGATEITARALDHRAGFLLSRMDGVTTVDTLLDIAGMARFDSLRTLSALLRAGLIKFK